MARAAPGEAVVEVVVEVEVLSLEAGAERWICLWEVYLREDESGDCEERWGLLLSGVGAGLGH